MTISHFKEGEKTLIKGARLLGAALYVFIVCAANTSAQSPPVGVLEWVGPNEGIWGFASYWSYSGSASALYDVICSGSTCTEPFPYVNIDNTTAYAIGWPFPNSTGLLGLAGLMLGANAPGGGLVIPGGGSVTVQGETDVGVNYPATVTITSGGNLINAEAETKLTVEGQVFYLLGPPPVAFEFGDFIGFYNSNGQLIEFTDPSTGQPFPGNIIPPSVLSSLVSFSSVVVGQSNGYIGGSSGPPVAGATPSGTVIVTGAFSQWQLTGNLYVGSPGQGTLQISDGGSVIDANAQVGVQSGATGTVTISGSGSEWQNSTGQLEIGVAGTGTLTVSGGATGTSADGLDIGVSSGGNGTVTLTDAGTTWTNSGGQVIVGDAGTGTLTIESGAIFTNSSNDTIVGNSGTGTLTVSGGGQLSDANGYIANNAGSTGTATITGSSSQWSNSSNLNVGNSGTGKLTVSSGGVVSDVAGLVGVNSGSNGTLTVSGTGSEWNNSDAVSVGVSGQGTVTVNTGAAGSAGGLLDIGVNTGSTGTMTLTDAGTTWENNNQNIIVGDAGTGTLKIQNGAALSDAGTITVGNYGTGTLSIGGSSFTSVMATVGDNAGSFGTVMVKGAGTLCNVETQLTVGDQGMGTLDVTKGGLVGTEVADVGLFGTSVGSVTVSGTGSELQANQLIVGYGGQGILTISSGGMVSDGNAQVGGLSGGKGNVTVSGTGSAWNTATTLDIGTTGKGTVTVSSGGVVSAGTLADPGTIMIGSKGTVDAAGGTLQGNVVNHGTLDPVGVITIEGDYTQGVDGTLILEVAGTGAADYGQFDVSGDATFDGTIDLDFIDGFAPSTEDSFDFINVTGGADFSGATFDISGLLPGFEYSNTFPNGQFTLTALNDGISSGPVNSQTPEPGTLPLLLTSLCGFILFYRQWAARQSASAA